MAWQKAVNDNVVLLTGVLRVADGTRPRRSAYMSLYMRVLPTGAVMAHVPAIRTQCHSVVNCQVAAISADMRGCTHVSCGVRTHAQLPAVNLKSTPLATRAN